MARTSFPYTKFSFPDGNPVAGGTVGLSLSDDAVSPIGQICRGSVLNVPLDSTGTMISAPLVWPNSQLQPGGTSYIVSVYSSTGEEVLTPQSSVKVD